MAAFYIDSSTCIDCGACVPECPFFAIFPEDEVPAALQAIGGEVLNRTGLSGHYEAANHHGEAIELDTTRVLAAGEVVDLTPSIAENDSYYR